MPGGNDEVRRTGCGAPASATGEEIGRVLGVGVLVDQAPAVRRPGRLDVRAAALGQLVERRRRRAAREVGHPERAPARVGGRVRVERNPRAVGRPHRPPGLEAPMRDLGWRAAGRGDDVDMVPAVAIARRTGSICRRARARAPASPGTGCSTISGPPRAQSARPDRSWRRPRRCRGASYRRSRAGTPRAWRRATGYRVLAERRIGHDEGGRAAAGGRHVHVARVPLDVREQDFRAGYSGASLHPLRRRGRVGDARAVGRPREAALLHRRARHAHLVPVRERAGPHVAAPHEGHRPRRRATRRRSRRGAASARRRAAAARHQESSGFPRGLRPREKFQAAAVAAPEEAAQRAAVVLARARGAGLAAAASATHTFCTPARSQTKATWRLSGDQTGLDGCLMSMSVSMVSPARGRLRGRSTRMRRSQDASIAVGHARTLVMARLRREVVRLRHEHITRAAPARRVEAPTVRVIESCGSPRTDERGCSGSAPFRQEARP